MRLTAARLAKAMFDFKGKHILITGGSSGIGRAVAVEVAKRGSKVTLLARTESRLSEAKKYVEERNDGSANVMTVAADVAGKYEDVEQAIRTAEAKQGPVDVLVNSAGISVAHRFEDTTMENFKRVMDINVIGSAQAAKAVVPAMKAREDGRIVFVASLASVVGIYGYTAYCASKFAVRGMAEALNQEVKFHNVKVIVTNPPDVDTPMLAEESLTRPKECELIAGTAGLKQPEDVAGSIVDNISSGAFMGYQGFDGWMLTTVSSGLAPIPSFRQGMLEVMFMSPLRLVGMMYQRTWDKIIRNCKKESDAANKAN